MAGSSYFLNNNLDHRALLFSNGLLTDIYHGTWTLRRMKSGKSMVYSLVYSRVMYEVWGIRDQRGWIGDQNGGIWDHKPWGRDH